MKKIWSWFEGKKMFIGLGIIITNSVLHWQFPDLMPDDVHTAIKLTGEAIGGIGMADRVRREFKVSQKIKDSIKNE